jgi:4-alpha-glucanotransferase
LQTGIHIQGDSSMANLPIGPDILNDFARFKGLADKAAYGFRRTFAREDGKGLYDVVGGNSPDASIRPNQIFAVSLPYSPLSVAQQKRVIETVEWELLTAFGLRTLAANDPAHRPAYSGGPAERDSAYHQGTVWPWLLGAFASAHYRVYGDAGKALCYLAPMRNHLLDAGIGSISEILDAERPHAPNGCIAQAWSVAEILRACIECREGLPSPARQVPEIRPRTRKT